jgi:hypothetical protein
MKDDSRSERMIKSSTTQLASMALTSWAVLLAMPTALSMASRCPAEALSRSSSWMWTSAALWTQIDPPDRTLGVFCWRKLASGMLLVPWTLPGRRVKVKSVSALVSGAQTSVVWPGRCSV